MEDGNLKIEDRGRQSTAGLEKEKPEKDLGLFVRHFRSTIVDCRSTIDNCWVPVPPRLFRLAPSGNNSVLRTFPLRKDGTSPRWIKDIATAPDGSVYNTENRAVRKITPEGNLTTIVEDVALPGCDSVPGIEPHFRPDWRCIDVDSLGTVYVAASGCRAILKISPDRNITTVLRASSPWSPTGVAVFAGEPNVLEYTHTASDNRREWLPRVRKLASNGQVVTVATIER